MSKVKTVLAIIGGVALIVVGYLCRGLFDGRGGGRTRPDPSGAEDQINAAIDAVADAGGLIETIEVRIEEDAGTVADLGASVGAGAVLIQRGQSILVAARARAKDNNGAG